MFVLSRYGYRSVIRLVRTISNVRVRFAPSPTGYMHIGGLRTALINKLFALRHNGKFILRIEDTDKTRYQASAFEDIVRCLRWAGLDPDEGPMVGGNCEPYVQSQRRALYARVANKLVELGAAYPCFCSVDRLDLMRNEQRRRGETPRYDNRCRTLTRSDVAERLQAGQSYAIRFKVPNKKTTVMDMVFGEVEFDMDDSEGDFVLLKSDGMPVYHLANVVDDHYMDISHVIRGVFDLSHTSRQNVYISPDILRLCGRVHFDRFATEALALCCRSHNTSTYISCDFLSHVRSFLRDHFPNSPVSTESCTNENDQRLAEQLCALRGRVACLSDLVNPEHGFSFMWSLPKLNTCTDLIMSICAVSTVQLSEVVNLLDRVMAVLASTDNPVDIRKCIIDSCCVTGIKQSDAMRILRTCLSGRKTGLPVVELIQLLGVTEAVSRVCNARDEIMRNGDMRNRG
ncbi:glutamyl-tRNA synthetase [Paragonimus westermani]|uniref:Glutamyl-tRNA synthetase n=1 Tax=Paragonimus westermani TaxID=34504 RepID=A0A5J4NEM6_9TREM|nr:glutamyl-tRNA synthetase [Paragonimus westermani]